MMKTIPRPVALNIFPGEAGLVNPNRLVVRLQPDEGIKLQLVAQDPGPGGLRPRNSALNLSFAEAFKMRFAEAYERPVTDMVRGDATLFMRRDEVEPAWSWVEPILDGWSRTGQACRSYAAGPGARLRRSRSSSATDALGTTSRCNTGRLR